MISAKIILDSITDGGSRLTTWELVFPRPILAEINTHRSGSKNTASSRAIPAAKLRERVINDPFIPIHWGKNQRGMQAFEELSYEEQAIARDWWLRGRDLMTKHHAEGEALGLHKQIVNRVIEPWMWTTQIYTATEFANLFFLRDHGAAEPHFHELAQQMHALYYAHLPTYRAPGEWHLPYIREDEEESLDVLKKVSTGRCARVSYLTHAGVRDPKEDVALHDKLLGDIQSGEPSHLSPFEHPCMALGGQVRIGNVTGWRQYRKEFSHEAGPDTSKRCARCGIWNGRHVTACPNQ